MKAYLGIGSNISAEENIVRAKQALSDQFEQVRFSRTFESEAIGFKGDNFLNLVAEIKVSESLELLIDTLKKIENELGRVRNCVRFSSRHIDIDILLYGDMVCDEPIVLPREEVIHNAYVLWPLSELAPDLIAPGGKQTYNQLWQAFDKTSQDLRPLEEC